MKKYKSISLNTEMKSKRQKKVKFEIEKDIPEIDKNDCDD